MDFKINTIEEAIEDFREGKFLIVVDDEDRENEGDFIIAAEKITPEAVNFMLKNGRGVLCAPLPINRCKELELDRQVSNNTSMLGTPFTVTVDFLEGCTTGVSIHDRATTIRALADPKSKPEDFGRPGHINPLYAQERGVLRRAGHTEASIDLARLAGLYPAAALIEIMNEDGTMARMPDLQLVAKKFGIKIITIKDLIAYRIKQESIVEMGQEAFLPTAYGDFKVIPFRQKSNDLEHIALIKGSWEKTNRYSCVFTPLALPEISSARSDVSAENNSIRLCKQSKKRVKVLSFTLIKRVAVSVLCKKLPLINFKRKALIQLMLTFTSVLKPTKETMAWGQVFYATSALLK